MAMATSSDEALRKQLLRAASAGNLELLKKLGRELDRGDGLAKTIADVKDVEGQSTLIFAAGKGRTHICKYLLQDLKLDANVRDGIGETPLNHATGGKHHQTVLFLLENGANPNFSKQ